MKTLVARLGALACVLLPLAAAAQELPPEVASGRAWLMAQVQGSGDISGSSLSMATPQQVRAEVLESLRRLGPPPAALVARVAGDAPDDEIEHLTRALTALASTHQPIEPLLVRLRGLQNADGGFGGQRNFRSTVLDTSLALLAFRAAGITQGNDVARAVDFLVQSVHGTPSDRWHAGTSASPYLDAYRLLALQTYSPAYPIGDALATARQRLLSQRQDLHYLETLLDCIGAIALGFGTTSDGDLVALRAAVRTAQSADGSWNSDPFLTALALRALYAGAQAPQPTTGRVTVQVRDRASQEPLAGAQLTLSQGATSYSAEGGADGNIALNAIPPQTYSASIQRSGYITASANSVAVAAGVTTDLGIVLLDRANDTARLVGQVSDVESGDPVAGAAVTISGDVSGSATTGPDGRYEFSTATAGLIDIQVSMPGYLTASGHGPLVLGGTTNFSPALYREGTAVPNSAILIGQLLDDATGAGLPGASIDIASTNAVSAIDGRFRISDLAVDSFVGTISKPGYQSLSLHVSLAPGINNAGVIRMALVSALVESSLRGQVRDAQSGQAIANAVIRIEGGGPSTLSDAQGGYLIEHIASVPFEATASAPGYASARISAGASGHSNFVGDYELERLAASDVIMEGVAMSAPEFDPFSEVGVLATVRNNGDSEAGLIFHALVMDSAQQVIRDVPAVQMTLATPFEDTIKRIPAGQSIGVAITWPNLDDLPGDYSVLVRGESPQGQVMVEGSTGYRQNALARLGGAVVTDPPLLQAGTGQPVSITAQLLNMGNTTIPAGDARLDITLVAADNRPPVPAAPVLDPDFYAGAPLSLPVGGTRDADGNRYTVNQSTRQLVRILPGGSSATVLTTLPSVSGGSPSVSLGTPVALGLLPDGRLRVVHTSAWAVDVVLASPYTATATALPTSVNTSYLIQPNGDEYFGGQYQARTRVVKRTAGGEISVLAEAGFSAPSDACVGTDGDLYVTVPGTGSILRVDAESGLLDTFAHGPSGIAALAFDSAGVLHTINSSSGELRKYDAQGASTLVASGLQFAVDMQPGQDGNFYVLMTSGIVWRVDATGQKSLFASGSQPGISKVAIDPSGNVFYSNSADIYVRAPGSLPVFRFTAAGGLAAMAARPDGSVLAAHGSKLTTMTFAGPPSEIFNDPAVRLGALHSDASGELVVSRRLVAGTPVNYVVNSYSGGALSPIFQPPFASALALSPETGGSVVTISREALARINRDGTTRLLAPFSTATELARRGNGNFLVYDSAVGLYDVSGQTGLKTQLQPVIFTNINAIAQSAAPNEIWFTRSSNNTLYKLDVGTGGQSALTTLPAGNFPSELVARNAQGDLLIRSGQRRLYRWDGAVLSDLGYADIDDLFADELGTAVVRRGSNLYWLDAAGTPGVARPLSGQNTLVAAFADRSSAQIEDFVVNFRSEAQVLLGQAYSMRQIDAIARLANGDIALLDAINQRGFRWNGTVLARIPGNAFDFATGMVGFDGQLYAARSAGIYRVSSDGSTTLAYTLPAWGINDYRDFAFQPGGQKAVLIRSSVSETAIVEGGVQVDGFAQLRTLSFAPSALVQRQDGGWWVAAKNMLVDLDATGTRSSVVSTADLADLSSDAAGRVTAVLTTEPSRIQELTRQGTLSLVAGVRGPEALGSLKKLAAGVSELYAVTETGRVYKHQGNWLEHHASGINTASGIALTPSGRVLVADSGSRSINEIIGGRVDLVAALHEAPTSLCAINDERLLAASDQNFFALDLLGAWSFSSLGGTTHYVSALECASDGSAVLFDRSNHKLRRAHLGAVLPPLPVGSVVHSETRPFGSLARSGRESLPFASWLPPVGGDYSLSITPLNNSVQGMISTGLHVGPTAGGRIGVSPGRVTPIAAEIHVESILEGADFTRLARMELGQITHQTGVANRPFTLGLTPTGGFWYQSGAALFYADSIGEPPAQIGAPIYRSTKGELPVDALGRAYVAANGSGGNLLDIRRVKSDSSSELVASLTASDIGSSNILGMTMTAQGTLFVLTTDRIVQISNEGQVSPHTTFPAETAPQGLTHDGEGALYVQARRSSSWVILYIPPDRSIRTLIEGIGFENEGVNIAGDCAGSLFFTPYVMPTVGQDGEEFTIVQMVGSTGELGLVLNGKLISNSLTDMDYIGYDRFSSALVVWGDLLAQSFTRIPITCGAIDIDYHLVVDAGQPVSAMDPVPAQQMVRADGATEYVWSMREVNAQGVRVGFNTVLGNLQRGEDRPVAREAFLQLRNSFQPGALRVPVQVPSVHVDDLAEIDVTTDRSEYGQHTAVDISVQLTNLDVFTKQSRLRVRVLDEDNQMVSTLIDRPQVLAGSESLQLNPPFNTADRAPGAYRIVVDLLAEDTSIVAHGEGSFAIVAGTGLGPSVAASVSTDQPSYNTGGDGLILASIRNLLGNTALTNLSLSERVVSAGGAEIHSTTTVISNLAAASEQRLQFPFSLQGVAPGQYQVEQQVRDEAGSLLHQSGAAFEVTALAGAESLTGSLTLGATRVRRGVSLPVDATIRNRGTIDATAIQLSIEFLDPQSGTVAARFDSTRSILAGADASLSHSLSTNGLGLHNYIAVLRARTGNDDRVLDQATVLIEDVDLAGVLVLDPDDLRRGGQVTLTATTRNNGNIAATELSLDLTIENATTGTPISDWHYAPTTLATNSAIAHVEIQPTQPLPIGTYRATLSSNFEASTSTLVQQDFTVRDIIASGSIQVSPASAQSGVPFEINASLFNTGNLGAPPGPARIQILRLDTQVEQASWTETVTLAAGQSLQLLRQFSSDSAAAGDYQAVLSAEIEGTWIEFSRAPFTVERTPANVDFRLEVPRDARLLVLMSCSAEQAAEGAGRAPVATTASCEGFKDGFEGEAAGPSTDFCEVERRNFLGTYLAERGISHKIVHTSGEFMRELRCGRHNLYWLSGGADKLTVAETRELREVVYRGEGLMHDGNHGIRNAPIDTMLGINYLGMHPGGNLVQRGSGTLFPAVDLATYGSSLNFGLTTGQIESSFPAVSAPAIVSNSYGQGRTLVYAFDLIASLQRDAHQPAVERLLENALVFSAPMVVNPNYAAGAYVPVTAVLENQGQSADLRLQMSVAAPSVVESSSPLPQAATTQSSSWELSLQSAASHSFDLNVRLPGQEMDILIDSQLAQRFGTSLEPLGNRSKSLAVGNTATARAELEASLLAANLTTAEQAARSRALAAISAAADLMQNGLAEPAILKWVEAAIEVSSITSVSHAPWRLAISRLMEHAQRKSCRIGAALCGTSTTVPIRFDDFSFATLNGSGYSLFAQSGGIEDWEWSLAADAQINDSARIDLDWINQQPVRFVATFNANGSAAIELFNGATSLGSASYPAGSAPIQLGSALQFVAHSTGGISTSSRIRLSGIKVNGIAVADEVATLPSSLQQESVISLYWPELSSGGTIEGTIGLDFAGCWPPGGPSLSIGVRLGGLSCNGGVQ